MKAAILAVGTELTAGQILNRNAGWISEKLKSAGMLTELHLTVPDDRKLILESIQFCVDRADLIFITGGLGPTSDDFTRELVSQWRGLALEFDPGSWQHINERLNARGYQVGEIQRQQCYFPKGSHILKNSQGTANAFCLKKDSKTFYVLPGPPREIMSIWDDFIASDIKTLTKSIDRHQTLSWDTMGFGESQIAERVEKIAGSSGFEIGYRVHLPYVEVKFSFFESERERAMSFAEKIDHDLSDCTVTKNGEDILRTLVGRLAKFESVEIYDSVTGGILWQRLLPECRSLNSLVMSSSQAPLVLCPKSVQLSIKKLSESEVEAKIKSFQSEKLARFNSQLNSSMSERKLQIFTERALIFWSQEL